MRKIYLLALLCILTCTSLLAQMPSQGNAPVIKQETINLTKADFLKLVENYEENPKDWVYLGNKPCIIDFYATWCGPCRRLSPIMEELALEYKGNITFYKIDTDKEKELAEAFGIKSIPTMLFCPMKGNPQMAQGALPKSELIRIIDNVLLQKQKVKKKNKKTTTK